MEYRRLGDTQLHTSVLGLGCSRVGTSVFEDNKPQATKLLEWCFDAGINFFDTAPRYAYGDSEAIIGKTFANRRDKVLIATKGGYKFSSYSQLVQYFLPAISPLRKLLRRRRSQLKARTSKRQDFSPRTLRKDLEGSLRRLRTDYVDLYQLHSPPALVIASDEVRWFLESLVREGKARYCAASVGTLAEATLCLEYPVFSALQVGFSLVDQDPAAAVFPMARSKGVGIIVKTPLHRGILTAKHRIATGPAPERPDKKLEQRRHRALSFLQEEQDRSLVSAAFRFIIDHSDVATVLTGTCNIDHLRQNITAVSSSPLPEEVMTKARDLKGIDWGLV